MIHIKITNLMSLLLLMMMMNEKAVWDSNRDTQKVVSRRFLLHLSPQQKNGSDRSRRIRRAQ